MNIKSLKKVAKVVAAVAMVGVVSGCVSVPGGTPVKGEVMRVKPWAEAREDWAGRMPISEKKYGADGGEGVHVVDFRTVNDVFGGSGRNRFFAIVPAGVPAPAVGQFIEIIAGDAKTSVNTFSRILPANCGWRGSFRRQEVECD